MGHWGLFGFKGKQETPLPSAWAAGMLGPSGLDSLGCDTRQELKAWSWLPPPCPSGQVNKFLSEPCTYIYMCVCIYICGSGLISSPSGVLYSYKRRILKKQFRRKPRWWESTTRWQEESGRVSGAEQCLEAWPPLPGTLHLLWMKESRAPTCCRPLRVSGARRAHGFA